MLRCDLSRVPPAGTPSVTNRSLASTNPSLASITTLLLVQVSFNDQFEASFHVLSLIAGIVLTLTVLWETFETIILPRRVRRRFRLTRLYYRGTWKPWSAMVHRIRSKDRREALLSFYGPLSLIGLLGLWAASLVLGFALVHYGLGSHIRSPGGPSILPSEVYGSGTTLFSLGLGDGVPTTWPARMVTVIEPGFGFGFLAIVIGYLPVLYQSSSRREVIISMLDARAGSPPTAA